MFFVLPMLLAEHVQVNHNVTVGGREVRLRPRGSDSQLEVPAPASGQPGGTQSLNWETVVGCRETVKQQLFSEQNHSTSHNISCNPLCSAAYSTHWTMGLTMRVLSDFEL